MLLGRSNVPMVTASGGRVGGTISPASEPSEHTVHHTAKLIDFGLARVCVEANLNASGCLAMHGPHGKSAKRFGLCMAQGADALGALRCCADCHHQEILHGGSGAPGPTARRPAWPHSQLMQIPVWVLGNAPNSLVEVESHIICIIRILHSQNSLPAGVLPFQPSKRTIV